MTRPVDLPRVRDRISFLYVEHAAISQDESTLLIDQSGNRLEVPVGQVGSILLGPGSSITHRAIALLGDAGVTATWVGEGATRFYAHGRSLSSSGDVVAKQASLSSHPHRRAEVARRMYQMRFPGEDVTGMPIRELQGREGVRVRRLYRQHAEQHQVAWAGRDTKGSDAVNRALSVANAALYGAVTACAVSVGASPALGFIHSGTGRDFVLDVADLFKAEITIPVAFRQAATSKPTQRAVRHAVRDEIHASKLMSRCAEAVLDLVKSGTTVQGEEVWLWGAA